MHIRERMIKIKIVSAGKLCNDDDFLGFKMDEFCGQILDSLENNQSDINGDTNSSGEVRIFCIWV